MKKHFGEKSSYIISSVVFPLMIYLTLKLSNNQIKMGKISIAFIIALIVTSLIGLVVLILLIKLYVGNFLRPKEERFEYKKRVASNMLSSCITCKLTGIPLLILLIKTSVMVTVFVGIRNLKDSNFA